MLNVTTILALDWYQNLMQNLIQIEAFSLPFGLLMNPRIIQQLPITIMLTIGGALLAWFGASFYHRQKINRVKILYHGLLC